MALNETTRVLRIFKLIQHLDDFPPKSVERLSTLLDVSDKSVYRYLNLLREIGYDIQKNQNNQYSLTFVSRNYHLEDKEKKLILASINAEDPKNTLVKSIVNKLKIRDHLVEPQLLNNLKQIRWIQQISNAIELKLPLVLIKYNSTSENSIVKDRTVLPVYLDENKLSLTAYEFELQEFRIFKLARIEDIKPVSRNNYDFNDVEIPMLDMFGMAGKLQHQIELKLSKRAKSIMIEELPAANPFITHVQDEEFPYLFIGPVSRYEGVGRFVLGMLTEIKVVNDSGFKEYLRNKLHHQTILMD